MQSIKAKTRHRTPAPAARPLDSEELKANRLLWEVRRIGSTATRFQLAKLLHISNSRVCDLVQDMVDRKILLEEGNPRERRGRNGSALLVNPGFAHVVGFDMEATRLRMCMADFAGRIVWEHHTRFTAPQTRNEFSSAILRYIEDRLKTVRKKFPNVIGIGVAATGIIDAQRGVILRSEMAQASNDLPLRDLVAERSGLPCCMENNIRMLTLAEAMNGAGRHFDSFICLGVRSGVGAGIVLNRKLYCGVHGFAGEPGYAPIPIGPDASQWKSLQRLVSEVAFGVDAEAAEFSLSAAQARRAGEILGAHIAGIASLLDPQGIVLAGALVRPEGPLWDHIVRTFRKHVLPDLVDRVQIVPAQLGPFAAALGAAHRCIEMLYPTERAPAPH